MAGEKTLVEINETADVVEFTVSTIEGPSGKIYPLIIVVLI